jgi:neutral ceramidase
MFFRNVREAVLDRLDRTRFNADNVVLTATHTHAGVGGFSCYRMYNMTTDGFQPRTYQAIVDGVVAAIERADADLAPGRLVLSRGELYDASVNRSPQSFDRNPDEDRSIFPQRIDPTTTLLRFERDGKVIGVVNWFATHGTSLQNRNMLISGDNKGYAAYHWEQVVGHRDGVIAAFAQTNAGDMSPNVPDATFGPTDNDVENCRLIGLRQFEAAYALCADPGIELAGELAARVSHVRIAHLDVGASWCPDGRAHRTGNAVLGAAFAAGTKEGRGVELFHEGVDNNTVVSAVSALIGRINPRIRDAQWPKAMLIPAGALRMVADVLPIQLVRIGPLVLVALAQEVTIVAGLRIRRTVAATLGVRVEDVIVQGYANDYAGYLTTPEEYAEQRYEGGHTMFGRWQLPAYLQEITRIATDLRDGAPSTDPHAPTPVGVTTPGKRKLRLARRRTIPRDPQPTYAGGDVASVTLSVPDPRGELRPNYMLVQRQDGDSWTDVTDDGDWSTTIAWSPNAEQDWTATMSWQVPRSVTGTFRLAYVDAHGVTPTAAFSVSGPRAGSSGPATDHGSTQ